MQLLPSPRIGIYDKHKNHELWKISHKYLTQYFWSHYGLGWLVLFVVRLQLPPKRNLSRKSALTIPGLSILLNCPKLCCWRVSIIIIFWATILFYNSPSTVWLLQQHRNSWFGWRIVVPALWLIPPYLASQSAQSQLNWCLIIVAFEFPKLLLLLLMLFILPHF